MGHEMNIELTLIEKIYLTKLPNIELKSGIVLNGDCFSIIYKTRGHLENHVEPEKCIKTTSSHRAAISI